MSKNRRIKVLLLTQAEPAKDIGGPGKFVPLLMEGIKQINNQNACELIAVMGLSCNTYWEIEKIQWSNVQIGASRFPGFVRMIYHKSYLGPLFRNALASMLWKRNINKVLKSFVPDIVHAHDFASVAAFPHGQFPGPLILTNHFKGSLYKEAIWPNAPWYRSNFWRAHFQRIEVTAIKRANILIFPSESARELLITDFPELRNEILRKSVVIYTGIPDPVYSLSLTRNDSISAEENDSKLIINISNHIPDKGIDIALKVFVELLKMWPNAKFVNYGTKGILTNDLIKFCQELKIENSVEFRGIRPHKEVLKDIQRSHLVIHTPRRVVFDLSLLEAMALKKVIIATPVFGNIEALGKEYPLLLTDEKPQLSLEQILLLNDKMRLAYLAEYLRKRYENKFTKERMAKEYIDLWQKVKKVHFFIP